MSETGPTLPPREPTPTEPDPGVVESHPSPSGPFAPPTVSSEGVPPSTAGGRSRIFIEPGTPLAPVDPLRPGETSEDFASRVAGADASAAGTPDHVISDVDSTWRRRLDDTAAGTSTLDRASDAGWESTISPPWSTREPLWDEGDFDDDVDPLDADLTDPYGIPPILVDADGGPGPTPADSTATIPAADSPTTVIPSTADTRGIPAPAGRDGWRVRDKARQRRAEDRKAEPHPSDDDPDYIENRPKQHRKLAGAADKQVSAKERLNKREKRMPWLNGAYRLIGALAAVGAIGLGAQAYDAYQEAEVADALADDAEADRELVLADGLRNDEDAANQRALERGVLAAEAGALVPLTLVAPSRRRRKLRKDWTRHLGKRHKLGRELSGIEDAEHVKREVVREQEKTIKKQGENLKDADKRIRELEGQLAVAQDAVASTGRPPLHVASPPSTPTGPDMPPADRPKRRRWRRGGKSS